MMGRSICKETDILCNTFLESLDQLLFVGRIIRNTGLIAFYNFIAKNNNSKDMTL